MTDPPRGLKAPPSPPPPPPPPKPWSLPPELDDEDDPFKEKRFQKELQFRMVGAIERGNNVLLQNLVKSGVDANAQILLVKTPLTHAVEQDEISCDIVTSLLKGGANPNLGEHTPRNLKALHTVAARGNVEIARIITEEWKSESCDLEVRDKAGCTPLHFAAKFGQVKMVEFLLQNSADINARDYSGCSALHRACESAHYDVVKYLLEKGHDVNAKDNFNWTPLFYSAYFVYTNIVNLLLQYDADLKILDIDGNSVLSAICYCQVSSGNFFPIQTVVATAFDYYERSRSIPPQDLKDHLLTEDTYLLWDSDIRRLEMLKKLINCGTSPTLCRTDSMAMLDYGEFAKRRMYLILAGSKLAQEDPWVDLENGDNHENEPDWLNWFRDQITEQYSLKRQCRNMIRGSVSWTRDINDAVQSLPVPTSIKSYLCLEDFDELMESFEHFQQKEDGIDLT